MLLSKSFFIVASLVFASAAANAGYLCMSPTGPDQCKANGCGATSTYWRCNSGVYATQAGCDEGNRGGAKTCVVPK